MTLLRSLLFFVVLALSVVVFSTPLLIGGRRLSYGVRCRISRNWGAVALFLLRTVCGLSYRVQGLDNLPDESAIVLAKHQSAWETIALRAILPPEQTWVIKRELTKIPFFGWALALFDPIAIDRSAGRVAIKQLLTEGEHWLKQGRWVVIFPEGTRVAPGTRRRYGLGGALLAERSGRPVVPIAHNAGVFWARRSIIKYPGVIDVIIGKPFDTRGHKAQEINRMTEEWIEDTVASLPSKRN